MSSLRPSAVVHYLESKGYSRAANAYRVSTSFGKGAAEPLTTITTMYNYVFDANEPEESLEATEGTEDYSDPVNGKRQALSEPKEVDSSECERCFLGNLSFKITESILQKTFEDCGKIVSTEWVTDKHTGQFYGSAFIVFETVDAARKAVGYNGQNILSRPVKVNFAPLKKSEGGEKRKMPPPPMLSAKPAECRTLFLGNLSFEVTEELVREFFGHCGEIYQVRFQLRENGDFKGCGFIEFADTYAVDEAIRMHARNLAGRPVRIDYA